MDREIAMACFESGTFIQMPAREAITLQDVRGATLRVTRGTLWITQEDDPRDVVLRVGDNWQVERDGATVLEAQDDAMVWVIGRHVEAASAARQREAPSRQADWRSRVAEVFAGTTDRYVPYV
jgi:hypothetical protein